MLGSKTGTVINLMAVIDGESFANTDGEKSGFLFTTFDRIISDNGTVMPRLIANPEDILRVSSISTDNQLIYAVFIYEVQHRRGDVVLDVDKLQRQTTSILVARQSCSQETHVPPSVEVTEQSFYNCMIPVSGCGTQELDIKFVIYGPPVPGEKRRCFLGDFAWPVSITVSQDDAGRT